MSFVITGSPGVGKHTITKEISKIMNLPVFDINQIAKEKNLFERTDETNNVDVDNRITSYNVCYTKLLRNRLHLGLRHGLGLLTFVKCQDSHPYLKCH